jgi:hypothetical protein
MVPGVGFCWPLAALYDANLFVREAMIQYRLSPGGDTKGRVVNGEEKRNQYSNADIVTALFFNTVISWISIERF